MYSSKNKYVLITTIVLIISFLVTLTGCWGFFSGCIGCLGQFAGDFGAVVGSGNLETREMAYKDFTELEIGSAFDVEITRDDSYSVNITVDDNLFEYLTIHQSGKTLKISLKSPWRYVRTTQVAGITMPELRELDLSGASEGDVSGFGSVQSLKITVSGASSLAINDLESGDAELDISGASKINGQFETTNVEVDMSGASNLELEGSADNMDLELSGSSRAELAEFQVENAEIEFSGASKGKVHVSGELDVKLSGASSLDYYGSPELDDLNISGGSSINKK